MKLIPVYDRRGIRCASVQVDDIWYDPLLGYQWCMSDGYVQHSHAIDGIRVKLFMHRHILGVTARGTCVDHIDGNPLNNQAANLRPADRAQNGWNRKLNKNNTSGYKGVSLCKRGPKAGLFAAAIQVRFKQHHLGHFPTADLAHSAYCNAAERLHGEFANFGGGSVLLQA